MGKEKEGKVEAGATGGALDGAYRHAPLSPCPIASAVDLYRIRCRGGRSR